MGPVGTDPAAAAHQQHHTERELAEADIVPASAAAVADMAAADTEPDRDNHNRNGGTRAFRPELEIHNAGK